MEEHFVCPCQGASMEFFHGYRRSRDLGLRQVYLFTLGPRLPSVSNKALLSIASRPLFLSAIFVSYSPPNQLLAISRHHRSIGRQCRHIVKFARILFQIKELSGHGYFSELNIFIRLIANNPQTAFLRTDTLCITQ